MIISLFIVEKRTLNPFNRRLDTQAVKQLYSEIPNSKNKLVTGTNMMTQTSHWATNLKQYYMSLRFTHPHLVSIRKHMNTRNTKHVHGSTVGVRTCSEGPAAPFLGCFIPRLGGHMDAHDSILYSTLWISTCLKYFKAKCISMHAG